MALEAVPIEVTDFATADPEAAREFFSEAFGDARLRVKDGIAGDRVVHVHRIAGHDISLTHLTVPSEIDATYAGRDREVLVGTVTEGTVDIQRGTNERRPASRYGRGDVFICNCPNAEWRHRNVPLSSTVVGLSESLLRDTASVSTDAPSEPWEARAYDPSPGQSALWREVTRFLDDLLDQPEAAAAPLVIGPAARLAAAAALTVFPNNLVGEQTMNDRRDAHPETLRRAIAFIEANPQMDISAAELAHAAHASPRAVQLAFRRKLDTTPTAYLRSVRLHHARQDLLAAGPDTRVTDIALRWGFSGPSRFAEYYRREYGEKPSETLRR